MQAPRSTRRNLREQRRCVRRGCPHGLLFGASRTTFSGERVQRLRAVQRQCRDALRDVYFQGAHGGLLFGREQGQRRGELNCAVAVGVLPLKWAQTKKEGIPFRLAMRFII